MQHLTKSWWQYKNENADKTIVKNCLLSVQCAVCTKHYIEVYSNQISSYINTPFKCQRVSWFRLVI
jgi:hypothetical protein